MARFEFVLAKGTWTEADIEREHVGGRPADVRVASLASALEVKEETQVADGIPSPRTPSREVYPPTRPTGANNRRAGIGLDAIDLTAAEERGIAVFHTPDYATNEVATHAVAMILALNRKIVSADAVVRRDWLGWKNLGEIEPFYEQTTGVIGAGRFGRATIEATASPGWPGIGV